MNIELPELGHYVGTHNRVAGTQANHPTNCRWCKRATKRRGKAIVCWFCDGRPNFTKDEDR